MHGFYVISGYQIQALLLSWQDLHSLNHVSSYRFLQTSWTLLLSWWCQKAGRDLKLFSFSGWQRVQKLRNCFWQYDVKKRTRLWNILWYSLAVNLMDQKVGVLSNDIKNHSLSPPGWRTLETSGQCLSGISAKAKDRGEVVYTRFSGLNSHWVGNTSLVSFCISRNPTHYRLTWNVKRLTRPSGSTLSWQERGCNTAQLRW